MRRRASNGTCCRAPGPSCIPPFPAIETFTFLDRNANRDVGLAWKDSVYAAGTVKILPCELRDLEQAWAYFRRTDLPKLSAVDATSFAIMKRRRIRMAYTFDHHFAAVGFRPVT